MKYIEHCDGAVDRGFAAVRPNPILTFEFSLQCQWVPTLPPTHLLPL